MNDISLTSLSFEDSGEWCSLPEWAEYFFSIGKQIAVADYSISRIATAIVVPTRAYCATFISLGMVISDATKRDSPSEASHFEKLFDLQKGTPVIYNHESGKTFRGIIVPPKELHGKLFIGVRVSSWEGGGLIHWINEERALQVQPAKHSGKLPKKQDAKNKRFSNEFVNSLLGNSDPVQLGMKSKLVCTIVGKKNLLEYEIRHTPFAVQIDSYRRIEGRLQDVLRMDSFTGEKSHRSSLIPVGGNRSPRDIISSKIEIGVIFDGAAGFLKWGSMWPDRHQVIILDRTEPYFYDAINAINSRFSQNRADVKFPLPYSDVHIPPGIEILAFREIVP